MRKNGFTLIELLIAIALMGILLSSVTMIFFTTTETVSNAEASQSVMMHARYAVDKFEKDLMGCLSFSSGQNRFVMENGRVDPDKGQANFPKPDSGHHIGQAADRISFRTTTTVGDILRIAEITYMLLPGNKALGAAQAGEGPGWGTQGIVEGAKENGEAKLSGRPLYTLVRRVRVADPGATNLSQPWTQIAQDSLGNYVADEELCRFIISFNFEYYASNQRFSQLEEPNYFDDSDPLGDGEGSNDVVDGLPGVPTPIRVPSIRLTMVVLDDAGERQERIFNKVMWIPMG